MPIPKSDLQTRYAGEARALAEAFEAAFVDTRVGNTWRPEMRAPDVQSTLGGVQATLRILLVPSVGPALAVGQANPKERSAELRTFEHADRLHRDRFDVSIAILPQDYDAFLATLEKFLGEQGLQVRRVGPPSLPPPSIPPPAKKYAPMLLAVAVLVVLAAVYLFVRH